jgi:hypothetical protein
VSEKIDLVVEERLMIMHAIEQEANNYSKWQDHKAADVLLRIVDAMKDGRI